MNERERRVRDERGLVEPARLGGETLLGCLGIGCILLAMALLWVGVVVALGWFTRLIPLSLFALLAAGVSLMLRVPSGATPHSRDPRRPLTRAGARPVIERPATASARVNLALALGLTCAAGVGYLAEVVAPSRGVAWPLIGAIIAGIGLWTQAVLVYLGMAPSPGWRWLRQSIGAAPARSGALAVVGLVAIGASLMLAFLEGFQWGAIGLAALLSLAVVLSPLARRAPDLRRLVRSHSDEREGGA